MPNHVTNILTFSGADKDLGMLQALMNTSEGHPDGTEFDFNSVLPMPIALHLPASSDVDMGYAAYCYDTGLEAGNKGMDYWQGMGWFKDRYGSPEGLVLYCKDKVFGGGALSGSGDFDGKTLYELGELAVRNLELHGSVNWYDWNCQNWGTKWNAYSISWISDCQVSFDTAWSAPHEVLAALSATFPFVEIQHEWADEDFGQNVGKAVYKEGFSQNGGYIENGSSEALDAALKLKYGGELPDHMRRDHTGMIQYIEEIETLEEERALRLVSDPESMDWPDKLSKWGAYELLPTELLWFAHSKLKDEFDEIGDLTAAIPATGDSILPTKDDILEFLESRGLKESDAEDGAS